MTMSGYTMYDFPVQAKYFPACCAFALALMMFLVSGVSSLADHKHIILKISGDITRTNTGDAYVLDEEDLAMLDEVTLRTHTPWTDGEITFHGPLLRDVLALVGAYGATVTARTLSDYQVDIPVSDALNFDVILARKADGRVLEVRNRGPLWVIYPWTDVAELRRERIYSRSVWQLYSLNIK